MKETKISRTHTRRNFWILNISSSFAAVLCSRYTFIAHTHHISNVCRVRLGRKKHAFDSRLVFFSVSFSFGRSFIFIFFRFLLLFLHAVAFFLVWCLISFRCAPMAWCFFIYLYLILLSVIRTSHFSLSRSRLVKTHYKCVSVRVLFCWLVAQKVVVSYLFLCFLRNKRYMCAIHVIDCLSCN